MTEIAQAQTRPSKMVQAIMDRARQAIEKAERAAQQAYIAYRDGAPKDATGQIIDAGGLAFAYVRTTRQGKLAFANLGAISRQRGLNLILRAFAVPDQSLTAQEKAISAGISVLNAELGDIGEFYLVGRMD